MVYKNRGFTIVELLVVIVIIGILAAITIVSYTGISQKATVASIQSDLTNASNIFKLDQVTNSGYPLDLSSANGDKGIASCTGSTTCIYAVNNSLTPQSFCLAVTKNSTTYKITNDNTPTQGDCFNYGLVLYLDAGNTTSYPSPFTGTTWIDLSGSGNNGTLTNGVGYDGSNGVTLVFDGIDDYVRLASPPVLGTGNFTIISVSKLTGGQGGKVVFGGGPDSTTGFYAHHYQFGGQGGTKWISGWGSANGASFSVQDYDLTSYHFAASVYNGSTNTMYTDGVVGSVVAKTNSNLQVGSYWAIGSSGGNVSGNNMAGNIGYVLVYNRNMSATEVSQIYNNIRGRFGI